MSPQEGAHMTSEKISRQDSSAGEAPPTTEEARELFTKALDSAMAPRGHKQKSVRLKVNRDALIGAGFEEIKKWVAKKPEIEPYNEKIRQLVAIAKRLEEAVEAAGNELRELGADQELRDAYISRTAITSINPIINREGYAQDLQNAFDKARNDFDAGKYAERVPLFGHSALLDLYLHQQSIGRLWVKESTHWNRFWRPGEGRPREFDVSLTAQLQRLCCKDAGLTKDAFVEGFQQIWNLSEIVKSGKLPKLRTEALKKRKQRDRKKPHLAPIVI